MRWSTWFLAAMLALILQASPAAACLNDRESEQSEKEFKSTYIEKTEPVPPPPSSTDQLLVFGGSGLGVALLVGACAVCVVRPRKD